MKPRFPLSEEILRHHVKQELEEQQFEQISAENSSSWGNLLSADSPLTEIFNSINIAITHAMLKESKNEKWKCIEYILYLVDPIMHKLLSLENEINGDTSESLLYSMGRLGICIFMGPIRRNCGKLGVSTKIYVKKMKDLLSDPRNANVIKVPRSFILWILFFGMLEAHGLQEEDWYLASLVKTAIGFRLTWESLLKRVSGFLWIEGVFEKELEAARTRYTAKLQATH